MIALILSLILALITTGPVNEEYSTYIMIAPITEEDEWDDYHTLATGDYLIEFDEIFANVEVKRAKNGRIMVKSVHSNSFRFAAK